MAIAEATTTMNHHDHYYHKRMCDAYEDLMGLAKITADEALATKDANVEHALAKILRMGDCEEAAQAIMGAASYVQAKGELEEWGENLKASVVG